MPESPDFDRRRLGLNPDSKVGWANNGALGSPMHLVFQPQPFVQAVAFCGAVVDIIDTPSSIAPYAACSRCLAVYREQEARDGASKANR